MNGGSNPKGRLARGRRRLLERMCGLTDDVRSIVLHDVADFRDVAAIYDPTGLCGLVELFLDFHTKLVCGAGSPVRSPMDGI